MRIELKRRGILTWLYYTMTEGTTIQEEDRSLTASVEMDRFPLLTDVLFAYTTTSHIVQTCPAISFPWRDMERDHRLGR